LPLLLRVEHFFDQMPLSMASSCSSVPTSPERGHWRQYAHCGQSRLSESYDLTSICPLDTLEMPGLSQAMAWLCGKHNSQWHRT
jgi:hypothetical protein